MRAVVLLFLAALTAPLSAAELNATPAASPILDPVKEGEALAAKLRAAAPLDSSEFNGVLEIDRAGKRQSIPIVSRISVTETNWRVAYRSLPTNGALAETLEIGRAHV